MSASQTGGHPWIRDLPNGVILDVVVTPSASRNRIIAEPTQLRVQLTSPPVDGAANDALIRLFANHLGLRRSSVSLCAGQRGRRKRIQVNDISKAQVLLRLVTKNVTDKSSK